MVVNKISKNIDVSQSVENGNPWDGIKDIMKVHEAIVDFL